MSATELHRGTIEVEEVIEDEDIQRGCAHIYRKRDGMVSFPLMTLCGTFVEDDSHQQSGCPGMEWPTTGFSPSHCSCGAAMCAYCRLLDNPGT